MIEQHPVPQNITSFEFKLVGDMTLKQFGYLVVGAVLAFIFYSAPWYPLIKLPLVVFCVAGGVSFAFVPIQERPLDTWVVNFFRSVYRPTQYFWRKNGNKELSFNTSLVNQQTEIPPLSASPVTGGLNTQTSQPPPEKLQKLNQYLQSLPEPSIDQGPIAAPALQPHSNNPVLREKPAEQSGPPTGTASPVPASSPPAPVPSKQPEPLVVSQPVTGPSTPPSPSLDDLIKARDELLKQIARVEKSTSNSPASAGDSPTVDDLFARRQVIPNTTGQAMEIKPTLLAKAEGPLSPPSGARIKVVKKEEIKNPAIGFQVTIPNTICGTVKSQDGQILPNTIVLVKNADGVSVRALRTNKVGQFLMSTPLEAGTYFLELDKEGYTFDPLQITLDGGVIQALEIRARG